MAFLGQEEQIREFQDRFRFLYAVLFLLLGLLMSRMVYLQILKGDQMRRYSEENRIKRVKAAAPRGMIFDRNRTLLIDNRPAFDLEITPQYLQESHRQKEVIQMLSRILHMPQDDINDSLEKARGQPSFMPVKIKTDLTRDEVAVVEGWKIDMPGVDVREEIKRTNVYGDIASHLLGYIGEVGPTELPILNKNGPRYKLGDTIGKFGLEQKMEDTLRGQDGEEIKEVDALGRAKLERGKNRVLSANVAKPAVPGKNLILTIDQDLQTTAVKAFGDKIGALVAIDPHNGQILAMISRPSFDPTEFARGISPELWAKLLNNPNHPLRDKTIQDHYPPGSTFKIVTAIAGLQEHAIDENTYFHCPGFLKVGNRVKRCWNKHGHGNVNVVAALTQSCDVFFYKTALKLKSVDDIAKWATRLGLGRRTGVPLAREIPGLIPTEEWKYQRYKQAWNPGETADVGIGQGYVLTTMIQLANLYAAFANGGTLYRPYLIKQIETYDGQVSDAFAPQIVSNFKLDPKTVDLVKQGLWGVVNAPHGTALASKLPGMDFVGKTGSAQVVRMAAERPTKCENMKFQERDNALFVGFAPVKDPSIAVAVLAEHACHGASGAAPIAKAVVKKYLEKYYPDVYGEKILAERLKAEGQPTKMPQAKAAEQTEDEEVISDDERLPTPEEIQPPPAPPPPVGVEGGNP
jgi:penicillin-binding protein 2